jgi:hypothetical protein
MSVDPSTIELPPAFQAIFEERRAQRDAAATSTAAESHADIDIDLGEDEEAEGDEEQNTPRHALSVEDKPAGKASEDTPASWLTPELAETAELLGFTPAEAEEFGSLKGFNAAVKLLKKNNIIPPASAEASKPASEEAKPAEDIDWKTVFDKEDLEDLDPRLAQVFDLLTNKLKSSLESLAKHEERLKPVDQIHERMLMEHNQRVTEWMDEQFATPELESIFGKGKVGEVSDEKFLQARQKVWNNFHKLAQDYPKSKADELFKKAVLLDFHDQIEKANDKNRNSALEAQGRRKLGNPGRSTSPGAPTKRFAGPMRENPQVLKAVREILSRN